MTPRRRLAYFSTLKFYFQQQLLDNVEPRKAYRLAKHVAATYAFRATTGHLDLVTL